MTGLYSQYANMHAAVQDKYKLHLPKYPGTAQCVKLNGSSEVAERQANPKQQGEEAGSFSELPPRVGS